MTGPCPPLRSLLYGLLFACSAVLLGLTAERIHYTKTLPPPGDILTTSSHFYDGVIALLLVCACLGIIFSLIAIALVHSAKANPATRWLTEHILMWPLWIMLLVGAAVMTHKWHNLKWCRSDYKVCRILEAIKAFSWIVWGLLTLALLASIIHYFTGGRDRDTYSTGGTTYETRQPEVRQANNETTTTTTTTNITHQMPVPATDANARVVV